MTFLWVALGGAIGATGRYGIWLLTSRWAPNSPFPWGTATVNVVGSFLLGFLLTRWGFKSDPAGPALRDFLAVGVLGGFTTFSTFSFETVDLLRAGQVSAGVLNVFVQLSLGLLACWAGILCGRG